MSEQLAFADMPERLFACTPSRLATFDCPRRYRFVYLDRPTPPRGAPWAHTSLGAAAHVALHRWWLLPRSQRVPERAVELVEQNWVPHGFRDERQSARACAATAQWVVDYLAGHVRASEEPVGVERTVAARTERLALSGRVDRIDDRDGELVVVDYKTSRRRPSSEDAGRSPALALYVLGVRRTLRRACRRVELHHLPTGAVAAYEHTEDSLAQHVTAAERTAAAIGEATRTDAFPPRPSSACAWCDFRRHCPEGRAAAPDQPSWAGLPAALADEPGLSR